MSEELSIDALWDQALVDRGFTDPRNGAPSIRALAAHLNVGPSTISNIRAGTVAPKSTTVQKIADALGVSVTTLSEWIGQQRTMVAPYVPPEDANLLDERERRAVDEVIRVMALPKKQAQAMEEALPRMAGKLKKGVVDAADRFASDRQLAARKGETRERKRRRLETAAEDQSQDPGDDQ